jgi:hypothetical protein
VAGVRTRKLQRSLSTNPAHAPRPVGANDVGKVGVAVVGAVEETISVGVDVGEKVVCDGCAVGAAVGLLVGACVGAGAGARRKVTATVVPTRSVHSSNM